MVHSVSGPLAFLNILVKCKQRNLMNLIFTKGLIAISIQANSNEIWAQCYQIYTCNSQITGKILL